MKFLLILLLPIFSLLHNVGEIYSKTYYENGNMKEEGWLIDGMKSNYWFTYYENGSKKSEGHYKNNKKIKWWVFYDSKENITKKCEFKNDKLNGLTIIYSGGNILKAEKYIDNRKVKTWTTIADFKRDN
ncbi:toxin-antitoxin system YwqK family antitoxin [Frigoriflavimonas asaccharolytica]|uniref:Antitoxin component YwqK of YwqJK toxin-antitoxin module n=1 Tax=Frigoriflavimonas asaccharolytica TaxID=2735899 RepID=A0A8J8G931_9FLAO|nr:hypothetical protein [Frigoriflavimonas asaccharolytica]NRS92945.1 antitoxin component YwqK of YwqJK toxin-antitoxin module [Frigoriflavimonas asaccharolytica]